MAKAVKKVVRKRQPKKAEEALMDKVIDAVVEGALKGIAQVKEIPPNHEHAWKVGWDGTTRTCTICDVRQWQLKCWTRQDWQYKAPAELFTHRKDLSKGVNGGANYIWSEVPHLIRSYDLFPEQLLAEPITVIGAGGIGSWVVVALGKMGFKSITVYDPQLVEQENTGTQLYGRNWVGGYDKAQALGSIFHQNLNGADENPIIAKEAMFKTQSLPATVVICAVDSMAARKAIWKQVKGKRRIEWFIDARMGAEQALMYVMNPTSKKDIASYEKTLYTDKQSVEEPCTARATVYTGLLIAGMIAKAVKDVLTDSPYPRVMHWNIAKNSQTIWQGNEPPAPPEAAPVDEVAAGQLLAES